MSKSPATLVVATLAVLSACERAPTSPSPSPSTAEADEKRSIFRPEFQVEPIEGAVEPEPLRTRIAFPEGSDLTEAAQTELAKVLASPQVADGGSIILRGHSDAGGSDDANLKVSLARAEAVRDWLVENGIDQERISIIPFGEQNPIEPNALADGTPNEAGRAANRRVEIEVAVASPKPDSEEPTLAESLSEDSEEPRSERN